MVVTARLTEGQHRKLVASAKRAGLSVSVYAAQILGRKDNDDK
jgi:predicted HicB family RNase H-like nuclease